MSAYISEGKLVSALEKSSQYEIYLCRIKTFLILKEYSFYNATNYSCKQMVFVCWNQFESTLDCNMENQALCALTNYDGTFSDPLLQHCLETS